MAGHPLGLEQNLSLAAASGLLALATVKLVENPVRFSPWLRARSGRSLALGAALTVVAAAATMATAVLVPIPHGQGLAAPPAVIRITRPPRTRRPTTEDPAAARLASLSAPLVGAVVKAVTVGTVPAKLAARAWLLSTSSARKTDLADAASVATAAIHHRRLRPVLLKDQTVILRLLSDRRDDLVAEHTRTLSRLHVLLADLHPGGATRELSATRAAAVLRQVRPVTVVAVERKHIACQLLADVRRLDRQVKMASQTIRTAVREHGTTLTEVFGVGAVLAAKLLGTPATSPGSLTVTTSPATPAPPRSRPPAAMSASIG